MKQSPEDRSRVMRAVKGENTRPEMVVRSLTHGMGYRFRLHRKELPGKPDLVFPALRKVIFVHGCFWHQHDCHRGARVPKSNRDYWLQKLRRTVRRDMSHQEHLRELGWEILIIWECELKKIETLSTRIKEFLG